MELTSKRKGEVSQSRGSLPGTRHTEGEEAGKQSGQYINEVKEHWGSTQINRMGQFMLKKKKNKLARNNSKLRPSILN